LSEAREKVAEYERLRRGGVDPLARKRGQLAQRQAPNFKPFALAYVADHSPSWKNPKHRQQWSSTLATYAFPKIGALSVSDIQPAHVALVLRPIWKEKAETARRLRGRIERILDAAEAAGYREGKNPAGLAVLRHLLPKEKRATVRDHQAVPYEDIPALVAELRERTNVSARALLFTILTAARTGEVIGAEWSEIDMAAWAVPADRMKGGKPHAVPLVREALDILEALPRSGPVVFAGPRGKLSNMAMDQRESWAI
jgi:integrase